MSGDLGRPSGEVRDPDAETGLSEPSESAVSLLASDPGGLASEPTSLLDSEPSASEVSHVPATTAPAVGLADGDHEPELASDHEPELASDHEPELASDQSEGFDEETGEGMLSIHDLLLTPERIEPVAEESDPVTTDLDTPTTRPAASASVPVASASVPPETSTNEPASVPGVEVPGVEVPGPDPAPVPTVPAADLSTATRPVVASTTAPSEAPHIETANGAGATEGAVEAAGAAVSASVDYDIQPATPRPPASGPTDRAARDSEPPTSGFATAPKPAGVKGGPEFPDILKMALDGSSLADVVTVQYDGASPRSRETGQTRGSEDDEGGKRRRRRRR
ncbi:MAG: hypothetical protein ACP5P9_02760 [Acidimicrobiales bacterium]